MEIQLKYLKDGTPRIINIYIYIIDTFYKLVIDRNKIKILKGLSSKDN